MACPPPRTVLAPFRRIRLSILGSAPEAYLLAVSIRMTFFRHGTQRTVSLPLSVQLSNVLPRLILWLIQNLWLLHPLQANVGYYGDSVTIQVAGLNRHTS